MGFFGYIKFGETLALKNVVFFATWIRFKLALGYTVATVPVSRGRFWNEIPCREIRW